jgi:hypothetical protein
MSSFLEVELGSIPLQETTQIQVGATRLYSSYKIMRHYPLLSMDDGGTLLGTGSGTHYLEVLLRAVNTLLDNIQNASFNWTNKDATNPEGAFRQLGQLIRQRFDGVSLTNKLDPTQMSTWFGTVYDGPFYMLWPFLGAAIDEEVGTWSRLVYRREDEALAGMALVMRMLSIPIAWHAISYGDMLNRAVTYESASSLGVFKPLSLEGKETWDSALFDLLIGSDEILGLAEDLVNSTDVRSFTLPIVTGAEAMANRLLSRSRWEIRKHEWCEVIPYYSMFIHTGESSQSLDCIELDKYDSDESEWRPWNNTSTNQLLKFISYFTDTVNRIRDYWFKNKALAAVKNWWTDKSIINLSLPEGSGGLLVWQSLHFKEDNINDDKTGFKWIQTACKSMDIGTRRGYDNNYAFDIRGGGLSPEVSLSDFRLLYGLSQFYYDEAGTPTAMTDYHPLITCKSCFSIPFNKYEPGREVIHTAALNMFDEGGGEGTMASINSPLPEWSDSGTWIWTDTMTKANMLARRSSDPFKKCDQTVYHINNLDSQLVRLDLLKAIFSSGPTNLEVSSAAEDSEKNKAGKHTFKDSTGKAHKNKDGENMEQLKARVKKSEPKEKSSAPEGVDDLPKEEQSSAPPEGISDPDDNPDQTIEEEQLKKAD